MTDEPQPRRTGQSLADYRLEQIERRMDKVENAISDFAKGQAQIKDRMTIAVWILVAAGGAFNILTPEILSALGNLS